MVTGRRVSASVTHHHRSRAGRVGHAALAHPYDLSPQSSRYTSVIACQMRALVAGMSKYLTETGARASITALTIAGNAPTVPAPLAPKGLRLVGTGFEVTEIAGSASARGIA